MAIDDALRRQGIDILEAEQVELDGAFEKNLQKAHQLL